MALFRKIHSFAALPFDMKWLFGKAWILSAGVKLTLVFLPFRRVLGWKGQPGVETASGADIATELFRKQLKSVMVMVARYAPWHPECYTLALTAKIILTGRGIPSTIYIGFRKRPDGKYEGHAWLRSFDKIITGEAEMNTYQVHSCFA